MTIFQVIVVIGCSYMVLDMVLGIALKRCVLPGLKCKACKR